MKKLLTKAFVLFFCFNIIACESDNDSENSTDPNLPSTNLDKESEAIINKYKSIRQWIGRWNTSSRKPDFIFLSDETCLMAAKYASGYDQGKWKYNPDTKYMTTTCGSWIWTVNDFNINEWTGITSGGTAFFYTRDYWNCPNDELLIGKWINIDDNTTITFKANNEYLITTPDSQFKGFYEVETENDRYWDNQGNYIIDKYIYKRTIEFIGDIKKTAYVKSLDGYRMVFSHRDSYTTYIYSDFVEEQPQAPSEEIDISEKNLVGHWRCVNQKWVEDGEQWESSYDISKDEYYVQFNADRSGIMNSGKDQLMEIMGKQTFTWSVKKGCIIFDNTYIDNWYIKDFSENEMTLYWEDRGYNITSKFKKD